MNTADPRSLRTAASNIPVAVEAGAATEEAGSRDKEARGPRRRHRALRDELAKISERKRAAASARDAKPRKPGGRFHIPEGRRAGHRSYAGILYRSRESRRSGSSRKGRGR